MRSHKTPLKRATSFVQQHDKHQHVQNNKQKKQHQPRYPLNWYQGQGLTILGCCTCLLKMLLATTQDCGYTPLRPGTFSSEWRPQVLPKEAQSPHKALSTICSTLRCKTLHMEALNPPHGGTQTACPQHAQHRQRAPEHATQGGMQCTQTCVKGCNTHQRNLSVRPSLPNRARFYKIYRQPSWCSCRRQALGGGRLVATERFVRSRKRDASTNRLGALMPR